MPQKMIIFDGRPGPTVRLAASDTAQGLPTNMLTYGGYAMQGAIISIEDNPVRIAYEDTDPTQGVAAVGHNLKVDDVIRVYGESLCATFSYINTNNGSVGVLQITPLYA